MGLDFVDDLAYDVAVAEVLESERAEARAAGLIN